MVRNILPLLLFMVGITMHGATTPLTTTILDETVRSLQVRTTGSPEGSIDLPVIVLDSSEGIVIEFDVLEDSPDYLRYSLVHCDRDWRPDQLAYIEYLDGFNEGVIDEYSLSMSTSVAYVHYCLTIPNAQVRPTISGNYVLSIYPENCPDNVMMRVRFAVSEDTANLGATWTGRTDVDYNRSHQQLEVSADVERSRVRDIFNDLALVITQNNRSDTRRILTKPMRISGTRAIYEHQPELIFDGGNEYRRFETVSKRYAPMGVQAVDYVAPYYRYTLVTDLPRSGQSYQFDQTLSGGYIVRDADNVSPDPLVSSVEADYAIVYFSLEMPELPAQTVFIDSEINQRQLDPASAMSYNQATGWYEKAMLLKQGAYSYQYVTSDNLTGKTSTVSTEGNHYETSNRYGLLLYHRVPGERYDRLIGHRFLNTK